MIFIVAVIVVQLILGAVGRLTGVPMLTFLVLTPLIQVVTGMVSSTGAAVLYVELRRLRDGVGPEALSANLK